MTSSEAMLVAECRLRDQRTIVRTLELACSRSKKCFFVGEKTFRQADESGQLFRLCRGQGNGAGEHHVWCFWAGGGVKRAAIRGGLSQRGAALSEAWV